MLNRSAGTSLVRSVGVARSCHKLDGDVTPPAKRQLDPTTATGSETGFLYGILQSEGCWVELVQTAPNGGEAREEPIAKQQNRFNRSRCESRSTLIVDSNEEKNQRCAIANWVSTMKEIGVVEGRGSRGGNEIGGFALWGTKFSEQPACEITRPMIKNSWVVPLAPKRLFKVLVESASGSSRWKEAARGNTAGVSQPKRASRPLNTSRYHLFHATIPNLESRRG